MTMTFTTLSDTAQARLLELESVEVDRLLRAMPLIERGEEVPEWAAHQDELHALYRKQCDGIHPYELSSEDFRRWEEWKKGDDKPSSVAILQAPERGPSGKRTYRLGRSEQYAAAVYNALKERGIAAPIHPPIRRQLDAAALLYRCQFRADDVSFILGVTRRHALVLKSQLKKERHGRL